MSAFLGRYTFAIDKQRRVAIPREWRNTGSDVPAVFYMVPGRERVIQVLPADLFETEILEKARKVSFANARQMRALARIGAKAIRTICDNQGRITMTPELIEHAGLDKQAVLVGCMTSMQIMTPETWQQCDMDSDEVLDQIELIMEKGAI